MVHVVKLSAYFLLKSQNMQATSKKVDLALEASTTAEHD